MKPRVFLAHRQGFAWFTSPHLPFIKLRRSRRARARRCRKLSGVISNTSAATVSLTPKMAPRINVKRCSRSRHLLRDVLGILRMVQHANGDVVDPCLVPPDQVFERLAISRAGA